MRISAFPHVIAVNHRAIDEQADAQARFRQVIRTFAATLKFLSMVTLSEYLRRPSSADDRVDEFLADPVRLARPSLGHFVDLLRRLAAASSPWLPDSAVAGLRSVVGPKGQLAKGFAADVDRLIHVRNIYVHADLLLAEDEVSELIDETRGRLGAILESLDWMADGRLALVRADGQTLACREEIRAEAPGEGASPGLWWELGGRAVAVEPFLIAQLAEPGTVEGVERVLQYETLQGRQIKYIFGPFGLYVSRDDIAARLREVSRAARERLPETRLAVEPLGGGESAAPNWADLVGSCAARSRESNDLQVQIGKYLYATYARRSVESVVSRFLASDRRLLVVVGESGSGKTNLLCRVTQDMLQARHAVLHYYGRQYQGEPFLQVLARDIVSDPGRLGERLAACGRLPEVAAGKRLVVLVDAVNEYSRPEQLFREVLALVEPGALPDWIKVLTTFRPVAWEHVEAGFEPNYDVVYDEPEGRSGRRPYVTLGPFTDAELQDAWTKWKAYKKMPADRALPARSAHLLRHPILFRSYLETLERRGEDGPEPTTPEEILVNRYGSLPEAARGQLDAVVQAMWSAGRDDLTDAEFTRDPQIEPWLATDQGSDEIAVYGCRTHPQIDGRLREVDEREMPAACDACGEPLVPVRSRAVTPPLDFLRDEGLLSLYPLENGGEILRLTFDRMYEALTARRVLAEVGAASDPGRHLAVLAEQFSGPEKAAVLGALRTTVLLGLHTEPDRWRQILRRFAAEPATPRNQRFLASVIGTWAEVDPAGAWEWTAETTEAALGHWWQHRRAWCGLQAGLASLERMLEDVAGAEDDERRARARRLFADVALDGRAAVDWDGVPAEEQAALGLRGPGDIAFDLLFDFCLRRCNAGSPQEALAVLLEVTRRLRGVVGAARHRKRLKAVIHWLLRIVTAEVEDPAFARGVLHELRSVLSSFPFLGPRQSRAQRWFRTLLLRSASVPLFAMIDERARRVVASASDEGAARPDIYRILHLSAEMEAGYRRSVELWADPAAPLGPGDMDTLIRLGLLPMGAPFSGVLRNMVGAVFSQRGIASADGVVGAAWEWAQRLPPGGEAHHPVNGIVWGALHAKRDLAEESGARVEEFLDRVLDPPTAVVLGRNTSGGNISVTLAALPLVELFRDDARLPRTTRFVEKRAARGDWAVVARTWDQLLFAGYLRVKPVLGYFQKVVSFLGPDRLRIVLGDAVVEVGREELAQEAAGMADRRLVGYDILREGRPREVAILHLLGTVGTLELVFPREVRSFYRSEEVPRAWISLVRGLSDEEALRKIRDEKMLTYAVNYCVGAFPEFREGAGEILSMLHADAAQRGFAPPTRESLVALLGRVLDRGLDLVYGVAPGSES